MSHTDVILQFLNGLAELTNKFRQSHIAAERHPALHDVSTALVPFRVEPSDYADDGVTLSIALNAELREPLDHDRKAIGMALLLRHAGGAWIAAAELGWSGDAIGWDAFESREERFSSSDEILQRAGPLVEWMATQFQKALERLCVTSTLPP
jgi:hypothetical protein